MEVILLQQIRKLGGTGAIVNVKNGYARNFLIPNSKALRATKDNIAFFESKKEEFIQQNNDTEAQAKLVADKIDNQVITIIEQAGEDGRLYGSVAAPAIAEALSQDVDRQQVSLNKPIKYIGVHEVLIELFGDITAKVNVNIARTKEEAKDAQKRFEAGEIVMEGPDGPQHNHPQDDYVDAKVELPKDAKSDENDDTNQAASNASGEDQAA